MALSAEHSGNVQIVHFYQHCARRQNVTVMQIGISPALMNFARSSSQEDKLELLPLKWTCSHCLVLLHNQGLLKVRWCNHRGGVAFLGDPSTSAVAADHIVPSDYMTLFFVVSIQ